MRERLGAVRCEVAVDVPGLAKIIRTFNEHGGWPESGENNDKMCKMELSFQIQLNRCVLLSVLRLPPRILQRSKKESFQKASPALSKSYQYPGLNL